jgi:hypothetical protein
VYQLEWGLINGTSMLSSTPCFPLLVLDLMTGENTCSRTPVAPDPEEKRYLKIASKPENGPPVVASYPPTMGALVIDPAAVSVYGLGVSPQRSLYLEYLEAVKDHDSMNHLATANMLLKTPLTGS